MIQYEVRSNKLNVNRFLQNLKCLSRSGVKARARLNQCTKIKIEMVLFFKDILPSFV
jgi:hypothetical protein